MNKGWYNNWWWSKIWNIFATIIGILSVLIGVGLFVFSIYFFYSICGSYISISITFLVVGGAFLLIHCIKYWMRNEAYSSMIFFLIISL